MIESACPFVTDIPPVNRMSSEEKSKISETEKDAKCFVVFIMK